LIDYFALALTHALIVIALLRVLARPDLDREVSPTQETKIGAKQARRERKGRRAA